MQTLTLCPCLTSFATYICQEVVSSCISPLMAQPWSHQTSHWWAHGTDLHVQQGVSWLGPKPECALTMEPGVETLPNAVSSNLYSLYCHRRVLISTDACIYVECDLSCGDPPAISNGLVDPASNITVTVYTCEQGYILSGSESITCNGSTGLWSLPPVCQQATGALVLQLATNS